MHRVRRAPDDTRYGRGYGEHGARQTRARENASVLMNYHFTTTKAHMELAGAAVVEIYGGKAMNTLSTDPFRGNIDIPKLEESIERYGPEHPSAGVWRLADPKISLASMASLFLGATAAARTGALAWGWLGLTILGIFAIEVAKNASGELVDFDSGADLAVAADDRSPFSGGKRVLVEGLLTRRQTMVIAAIAYGLGIAAGLTIVVFRSGAVLWLGLVGVACAFFYHAPPLRLSYRGFGELAVGVCYGPLIASGTYLVQHGRVSTGILLAGLPLGMLIAAFLWINEFPDYQADREAGKRTLVVRLGRRPASRVFAGLIAGAFILVALLPLWGLPPTVWLGLAGLIPGVVAARTVMKAPEVTRRLIPAQVGALVSFVLMAVGSGVGLLL